MCAIPILGGVLCGACLSNPPAFDKASAIFSYGFPIDTMLQSLKYAENLPIAAMFGDFLGTTMSQGPRCDGIIPMPLSTKRLRQRGFNQALEIARSAAKNLGIPIFPHSCERIRETSPQASLPWAQRAVNVRDSFRCCSWVNNKQVVIVDDVMTTGATLNELARALRKQGAAKIWVWTVARTLPHLNR